MKRLSDPEIDFLMDVATREQEKSLFPVGIDSKIKHATLSIAASNLVLAELMLREKKL